MSRNLLDIGEHNRHMEEGFGLVNARNNPMNLREKGILPHRQRPPSSTPSRVN